MKNQSEEKRSTASWLWEFAKGRKGEYLASVLAALIGVACSLVPYVIMIRLIQALVDGSADRTWCLQQCLVMGAWWVLRYLLHTLSTTLSHHATFQVLARIRIRLLDKLATLPLGTVLEKSSGSYKSIIVERVDSIETTLAHLVPEMTSNIVGALAVLVLMFLLDWRLALAMLIVQPLLTAYSYTDDLMQVGTIVGEVSEILKQKDMKRPETAGKLPKDNAVEVKDVCFAYRDKEVLHGVSLRIEPGTVNALVGPSGSGKSTIARLVASLWDVDSGSITLGGVDIRSLPLEECTDRIAYVSQDNYLFDLSVMDNIRMGRQGATDGQVVAAAEACGCHEFILSLEKGYDTLCGSSGGHLSGGERQRISIARAMLKDAPVVILDEATGYTDPENEAVVQSALAKLIRGKPCLSSPTACLP